jgi:hypothetical protein
MLLLLGTHALIWIAEGDERRVGRRARALIAKAGARDALPDPLDRFLAATARDLDAALMTADDVLLAYAKRTGRPPRARPAPLARERAGIVHVGVHVLDVGPDLIHLRRQRALDRGAIGAPIEPILDVRDHGVGDLPPFSATRIVRVPRVWGLH